ncbi:MAG: hypothetical protein RBT49_12030, partial [Bacteroidales bacterium]|nr:hypothetical protein [Bacteroidales bacterium]
TDNELLEMGKKIHLNKYKFKMREGFRFEKLDIPERIYQTNDPTGKITKEFVEGGINYAKSLIG